MALTINSAAKDGRGIAWDYPAAGPYCLYCLETATYGNASRVDPAGALRPTLACPITHDKKRFLGNIAGYLRQFVKNKGYVSY